VLPFNRGPVANNKGGASKGPAEIIAEETMKLLDSIAFFLFPVFF